MATPKTLLGETANPPASPVRATQRPAPTLLVANPVEQLARLADLHDRGALTDSEFAAEKARIINHG
jgi:hypothetical protein